MVACNNKAQERLRNLRKETSTTGSQSNISSSIDLDVSAVLIGERSIGDPSDDFLAALPALENMQFLGEELDPVEVDALFAVETFPTVHQLTSTVRARTHGTPLTVLKALKVMLLSSIK